MVVRTPPPEGGISPFSGKENENKLHILVAFWLQYSILGFFLCCGVPLDRPPLLDLPTLTFLAEALILLSPTFNTQS